jgi:ribonuclease HepT-like protein
MPLPNTCKKKGYCSALAENIISQVTFEIQQIDQLLAVYADLVERVQQHPPDLVEITAIASVLHSFYNGLENIFLSIAKGLDQEVPTGNQWHRDLLIYMTRETANRGRVISTALAQKLADYLGFRHFYRHSYSFFLEWGKLQGLVTSLREVWTQVKDDLHAFLGRLNSTENHQHGT